MAIYIKYEGIKGNCTAEGYEDHMKVDSLQFGVGRGITMEVGNLANRESTRPNCSEMTFTKKADVSATALFKEAVSGSAGKKVEIKIVQTNADKLVEYMVYTLHDALVSGYSVSVAGEADPDETVCLSYAKIEVKYIDQDQTNKAGSPNIVLYNLATAKAG